LKPASLYIPALVGFYSQTAMGKNRRRVMAHLSISRKGLSRWKPRLKLQHFPNPTCF